MIKIRAKSMLSEDFKQYGNVLNTPGNVARLDNAAKLQNKRSHAKPNLLIAKAEPTLFPMTIKKMERHPESSQTFFPLDVKQYLILVCPNSHNNQPNIKKIDAFVVEGNQGINYLPGVWHYPITTLDKTGIFAALVWEDGTSLDTEWYNIAPSEQPTIFLD